MVPRQGEAGVLWAEDQRLSRLAVTYPAAERRRFLVDTYLR